MDPSIQERVAATLAELGLPASINITQTMLMHDGYFVGHILRYDGGYAALPTGRNTIEFYDGQGKLLKAVTLGIEREAA
jgi:hypothetical protein